MAKRILFVCTGNTCRSPMAHGMLQLMAKQEGVDVEVRSAGVFAIEDAPISQHTAEILKNKGYQEELKSRALDDKDVEWADLVLTMTMGHKEQVIQRYPESLDKVYTLKEYVEDPEQLQLWKEREQFISEMEMKMSLNEPLTEEEKKKWEQYEQTGPDLDIADPFGGSKEDYENCAQEIETALKKLLINLKKDE